MKNNKSAFTLVELMVVLAIIALLSALIFGAISSIREGNKRGSCQSNLNQIYAAMRLYAQDNDEQFPYRNAGNAPSSANSGGLGLWALYVYAPQATTGDPPYGLPLAPSDPNNPAVLSGYLKSPRAFHCPSDNDSADLEVEFADASGRHLNSKYLSYQGQDQNPAGAYSLYSTFRGLDGNSTPAPIKRQIGNYANPKDTSRRAPDQTVVTWCRFHRSVADGVPVKSPEKTFDNVLFLDGSVQSVPVEQTVTLSNGSASATCRGWKRVPLAEANAVPQYVIDACNSTP